MLHALLHNKLDESIPEPQRLEDALTSTIIGTLALVDAADVLTTWLGRAKSADGTFSHVYPGAIKGIWFWPQLALAEPDAIIQLGNQLFVIEAKYRSGLHDGPANTDSEDTEEHISDQLCRQWQSLQEPYVARNRCPSELSQAIASCRLTLVLIVDARRIRRARRQFLQSVKQAGQEADLCILTWQSLHEILATSQRKRPQRRWVIDLCDYLENTGLQGFTGLRQSISPKCQQAGELLAWRCSVPAAVGLSSLFDISSESLEPAMSWNIAQALESDLDLFGIASSLGPELARVLHPARKFTIRGERQSRWRKFVDTSLDFISIE